MKICSYCRETKSTNDFPTQTRTKNNKEYTSSWCRECHRLYHAAYRATNRATVNATSKRHYNKNKVKLTANSSAYNKNNSHKIREAMLVREYGITSVQYDNMLADQDYCCAICGRTTTGRRNTKYFAVDHCHVTGRVRGLLCDPCNLGLGKLGDTVEALTKALNYLTKEGDK